MVNTRKQLWSQFQANVYNATQIILEFNFTENNLGGIALDDTYISPIMCAGNVCLASCSDICSAYRKARNCLQQNNSCNTKNKKCCWPPSK